MPATRNNNYLESARRSSFNGKDLTFVEVVYDVGMANVGLGAVMGAGTSDEYNSPFWRVSEWIRQRATILAQDIKLAADASVGDDTLVADITATDNITVMTFLVEGADLWGDGEAAQVTAIDAGILAALAAIGLETPAGGGTAIARPAVTGLTAGSFGSRVSTLRFGGDAHPGDATQNSIVGFPNGRDG